MRKGNDEVDNDDAQEVVWYEDGQGHRDSSSPGGSHTSGTEWSMADRSRPLDILIQRYKKKNIHIKTHKEEKTTHNVDYTFIL